MKKNGLFWATLMMALAFGATIVGCASIGTFSVNSLNIATSEKNPQIYKHSTAGKC
jgi:hypothetical protein